MFTKGIDKRIKILFFVFLIFFCLILIKVFYIQVFEYKKLNKLAKNLWSRDLEIQAERVKFLIEMVLF